MRKWYKNSTIYSVDTLSFMDVNGDGAGDFEGLNESLGYLNGLGIDCLWLLPIYDSPYRDNGYDVRDYYRPHPLLGDFGDFALFLEEAESRAIRVLIDLPLNHTSVDHPWFQEAKRDPNSKYHDYYIWCDHPPEDSKPKLIFGKQQQGNWRHVPEIGKYYYHTFYAHEADLNFTNPAVRQEIKNIMRFWLRQGVSGFRLDAVPHMLRQKGDVRFEGHPHTELKKLRAFVEMQQPSAVLLAEVDVEPQKYKEFFGEGDELHLVLNFYMCNYLFYAFASRSGKAISQALQKLPDTEDLGQWANFLRNHDELDLERLDKDEYEETIRTFAPEQDMRIFGRGIRRRLAPMLQDNRRRLELAYSLLLTLPGTPVLLYGEEIGMGDDLSRTGRDAVRLLMQWSNEPNGGFSAAPAENLIRPVMAEGPWGYKQRNVTDQRRDPGSLQNRMGRAIRLRRDCPEFGEGVPEIIDCGDTRVFAHLSRMNGRFALAMHNLCDREVTVTPELSEEDSRHMLDLFGDRKYEAWEPGGNRIRLEPYGYRWFRRTQFTKAG